MWVESLLIICSTWTESTSSLEFRRPVEGESRTHLVSQFSSDEVERQVTVVDYGITESAEERDMCKVRPTTERHLDLRRDAFNSDQRECAD